MSISEIDAAYQLLVEQCGEGVANESKDWIEYSSSLTAEEKCLYGLYCYLRFVKDFDFPGLDELLEFFPTRPDIPRKTHRQLIEKGLICKKPSPQTRTEGFVYLAQRLDTRLFKIGCSVNPLKRRGQIQKDIKAPVHLIAAIAATDMGALESEVHAYFREHHVHGEWFQFRYGERHEVVGTIAKLERFV